MWTEQRGWLDSFTSVGRSCFRGSSDDFTEQTTLGWLNRRDSTKARDDSYLNSLILPTFANMSLGAIHPTDIQQWIAQLDSQGYAPATIRKAYQLLGRILSDTVQAGLIIRSPCRNITLPRAEGTEMRYLSPDETRHLADTIDARYRAMVLTAAYTGCRFGEIAALDLDHHDPDRRIIRIGRSLSEVRGHLRISEPKTPAARRAITIPAWLPQVLTDHLTTHPAGPDGLIFTAPEGGPIRRNTFRSPFWLPAVADSVGLPMRFHYLRHSHVALLIKQGTHPAVIAARLGHVSFKTVLDVYGHLSTGRPRALAHHSARSARAAQSPRRLLFWVSRAHSVHVRTFQTLPDNKRTAKNLTQRKEKGFRRRYWDRTLAPAGQRDGRSTCCGGLGSNPQAEETGRSQPLAIEAEVPIRVSPPSIWWALPGSNQ